MTPEQQLQQLLTEAQELTSKMREALRHLPDYQSKTKLATNYNEVVEDVKPRWLCACSGEIFETSYDPCQLPTEAAAKQSRAFIQIKNLEAYCAERFEGEMHCSIIVLNGNLCKDYKKHAPFKFTREAAEWLIANHHEPFLVFYGVK